VLTLASEIKVKHNLEETLAEDELEDDTASQSSERRRSNSRDSLDSIPRSRSNSFQVLPPRIFI
jgi:hypothetical protein